MYRPRVIPVLLLKGHGLYKTKKFVDPIYLGDPINAVKIFNDAKADELIFLDIDATPQNKSIDYKLISQISEGAQMPFSYGGGLDSIEKIKQVFAAGCEKIVLNSSCFESAKLITQAAAIYGNQAVVVSVDVRRENNQYCLYSRGGTKKESISLEEHLRKCEEAGAGEFFINSIDRDGTREGYDLELFKLVSQEVTTPIIGCGGANDEEDMVEAVNQDLISAAAAGSMFVFMGKKNAVMINYPDPEDLLNLFTQ